MAEVTRRWMVRVGLDIAKQVVHMHAVDGAGRRVVARAMERNQCLPRCPQHLPAGCLQAAWWRWRRSGTNGFHPRPQYRAAKEPASGRKTNEDPTAFLILGGVLVRRSGRAFNHDPDEGLLLGKNAHQVLNQGMRGRDLSASEQALLQRPLRNNLENPFTLSIFFVRG